MDHLTATTQDAFSSLLEAAANNDAESFKQLIADDPSGIDEVGLWYVRKKGSKQMVFEHRTPLMVAAMYGSIDVLKSILSLSITDVNKSCGDDKSTPLHCAASGGSVNAVDTVKLLLEAGADLNAVDADGNRPFDVITVSLRQNDVKSVLEELLAGHGSGNDCILRVSTTTSNSNSNSPPLSSSPGNGSPSSSLESPPSPLNMKFDDHQPNTFGSEKKEYPIDPSLPDIKNSIYATDEFRMYSFKIRPCSRAYSHDWTECPFVHPGENARRRDPRKYHYSCVPCPDFRKGSCRRGDMCEYAHGVFECWLHPAQYRTRLCKDGTDCARKVCFFAHLPEELRPLYVSTGCAVPSPRSSASNSMDFALPINFMPGSPSSLMSPSSFTPPISPSAANGMSHAALGWPQPDVPSLRLPGSNMQSSRLRSSLNARDLAAEEFEMLNEFSCLSMSPNSLSRSNGSKTLNPSCLHDLFSAEGSSPCYNDQTMASSLYSPTHKSAVFNQFQQQQGMLSPINTNFSPKGVDHPLLSSRMSPRSVEPVSPMSARASMIAQREQQLHQFRSVSSRELGSNLGAIVGSPVHSWSRWGSSNGKPDWAVSTDETIGKLRRSSSFEIGNNGEEPDLSWVQTLVKESPTDVKKRTSMPNSSVGENSLLNARTDAGDQSVIATWMEQMEHDKVGARTTDNSFSGL